jgi:hypothetical protein
LRQKSQQIKESRSVSPAPAIDRNRVHEVIDSFQRNARLPDAL